MSNEPHGEERRTTSGSCWLRHAMMTAERRRLVQLRDEGKQNDEVFRLQREPDLEKPMPLPAQVTIWVLSSN